MTVTPLWRTRLTTIGAGLLALWLGADLALQDYFWPGLIGGGLILLTLRQTQRLPIEALLLGLVLFGYIAGNRGLVEFSVATPDADTLRFTLRRQQIEIDDGSVPADLGAFRDVDVDVSGVSSGAAVFVSFINDDLLSLPADVEGASWPTRPPF